VQAVASRPEGGRRQCTQRSWEVEAEEGMACFEARDEVAANSKAGDEAMVCSRIGIEDGRRRRCSSV
jgi:hypothetical protein